MAERLITPEDFTTGAPPRIMGIEAEDYVSLRKHSKDATTDELKAREDYEAVLCMISPANFEKAGITEYTSHGGSWLANGQRMYIDCELLESCTAEQLGPRETLVGRLATTRVVEKLAEASELDIQIFRRTATVNNRGFVARAGFHMNHITPIETAGQITHKDSVMKTHSETRLYTWEGMVSPDGFSLSQKVYTAGSLYRNRGLEVGGFTRVEDFSGDDGSPWGTFMAMATTSVLMRVLEHPKEKDLNKKLAGLRLSTANDQFVSTHKTLKETLSLADGREMTAIQIQTELSDIAAEFGKRFRLPEDEQYAVDEWQRVCRDLEEAAKTGDMIPLIDRIGWVGKKHALEKIVGEKLDSSNAKAVYVDMQWDSYYPKRGGRLLLPQKTGLTIASDAEVQALVDHPPQNTRAVVRSAYLQDEDSKLVEINWRKIEYQDKETVWLHPYQTER